MSDVTASYGTHLDFIACFYKYFHTYIIATIHVSEVLYHHQTFTDSMSNQYTHFNMMTRQM